MSKKKDDKYEVITKPNSKEIIAIRKKDPKKEKLPIMSGTPVNHDGSVPTLEDLLEFEFNVPDVSVSGFETYEDYEKFLRKVMRRATTLLHRNSTHMDKMKSNLDMFLIFLEKHPEMFAEDYGEINRDMVKWAYHEHMKKCREVIDRIQEIETELNLDMHHKW